MRPPLRKRRLTGLGRLLILVAATVVVPGVVQSESPRSGWYAREWRHAVGGVVSTPFAVAEDGRVYFAAEDRYLYAIEAGGRPAWRYDTRRLPGGILLLGGDDTVLLTVEPGRVVALNPDGGRAFSYRVQGRLLWPAVSRNGNIVIAFENGMLAFLTPAGRAVWQRQLEAAITAAPVLGDDGMVSVATAEGELMRLDQDGRIRRTAPVGEVGRQLFALGGGRLLVRTDAGGIHLLDANLSEVWRREFSELDTVTVDERCGTVVVVDGEDGVQVLGAEDGAVRRQVQLEDDLNLGTIALSPACDLVFNLDGRVAFLESESLESDPGEEQLTPFDQAELGDRPVYRLQIDARGRLLLATADWVVHALREQPGRNGPRQPAGRTVPEAAGDDAAHDSRQGAVGWYGARGDDRQSGRRSGAGEPRPDTNDRESESRDLELLYAEELFFSGSGPDRRLALRELRALIEEPRLHGRRDELRRLLRRIIGAGARTASPTVAELRAEAVALLALIGDLPSARELGRLASGEEDESVRVAYLRAFAEVRSDRSRKMLFSTLRYLRAPRRSERLELAAIEALTGLALYNGPSSHSQAWRMLGELAEHGRTREVRRRARLGLGTLGASATRSIDN